MHTWSSTFSFPSIDFPEAVATRLNKPAIPDSATANTNPVYRHTEQEAKKKKSAHRHAAEAFKKYPSGKQAFASRLTYGRSLI